jgi:hypothetical protein
MLCGMIWVITHILTELEYRGQEAVIRVAINGLGASDAISQMWLTGKIANGFSGHQ